MWAWGICTAGSFRAPISQRDGAIVLASAGGRWDVGVPGCCKLPALLTQTIVVLIPKDLDLCLKSQTDCLKIQPIPLNGEGNMPFPQGWMEVETRAGQV